LLFFIDFHAFLPLNKGYSVLFEGHLSHYLMANSKISK
jgi:hypothetical protein